MKKLTALLLALVLAMLMCTGALAEETNYAATWALTGMTVDGVAVDPAQLGMDMTIELAEDGICTITLTGTSQECTWAAVEGGIIITEASGAERTLAASAEELTLVMEGAELHFTPAAPEPEYLTILSGLSVADFNGSWVMSHVQTPYETYSAAQLGVSMYTLLADGAATITMSDADGTSVYQAVCTTQETSLGTVLMAAIIDPETGASDGSGLLFLRFNHDILAWYSYDAASGAAYYYFFTRAAE